MVKIQQTTNTITIQLLQNSRASSRTVYPQGLSVAYHLNKLEFQGSVKIYGVRQILMIMNIIILQYFVLFIFCVKKTGEGKFTYSGFVPAT